MQHHVEVWTQISFSSAYYRAVGQAAVGTQRWHLAAFSPFPLRPEATATMFDYVLFNKRFYATMSYLDCPIALRVVGL